MSRWETTAGGNPDTLLNPTSDKRSLIAASLAEIVAPGQVFEIRAFTEEGRVASGYFDDVNTAATAIEPLDGVAEGIYITPNPVNTDLLARRANRLKWSTKKNSNTSDIDIVRRRWLLIDVDPERPSGVSSTDEEHAAAMDVGREIASFLGTLGWPEPIVADSGNGAHLLYRIDLANDAASTAIVNGILTALDTLYSTPKAKVDTTVFNAGRIWKCYGTVAKKGDHTPSRPHRRSALCSVPENTETVTTSQLEMVAVRVPSTPKPPPHVPRRMPDGAIDLRAWLEKHGIEVSSEKPSRGGTLFNLAKCPFSDAHTKGASVVQYPSGKIYAGCHHKSCGARKQRWPELREMFDGPSGTASPGHGADNDAARDYLSLVVDGERTRQIDPRRTANYIHDRLHTISFNETIYCYKEGTYHENKGETQALIKSISDLTRCTQDLTKANREVMHHLTYLDPHLDYPFNRQDALVPVANGVIRIDYEAGGVDLLEHSHEYRFTFKLPVIYDPEATPEAAVALLSQYVVPEDVPLLMQILAQSLLQSQIDSPYKKAYLLQGEPNAGKSSFVKIMESFFGRENFTHVSLHALGTDRFCTGKLEGKLVNCYDDLSDIPLENIGVFKNLTGATFHGIEAKFKQGWEGRIFCVHVFTCNRPPRVPDEAKIDAAFWERWEYIRFPYLFSVDPDFYAKTLTPGFFSSLLAGVVRMMIEIRQRGALTVNRTASEVMERWTILADPLYQFIEAKMTKTEARWSDFAKHLLHAAYLNWCDEMEIDPRRRLLTINAFTRGLHGYGIVATRTSMRLKGEKEPYGFEVYRGFYKWSDESVDMGPGLVGIA